MISLSFWLASFDNPHNICEYARNQRLPYATLKEPDLDECPNLPANFNVAPYDADILDYEKKQSYRLYPTQNYTADDWRRYRNAYFRLVETVDYEIGKIVNEIERQNLWKTQSSSLLPTMGMGPEHINGIKRRSSTRR